MSLTKLIKISDLGQLEIKKTEDVIYLIESSIELTIKAGVNAKIIDSVNNGNIHISCRKLQTVGRNFQQDMAGVFKTDAFFR